jgi:PAS domain S-box-containing protein
LLGFPKQEVIHQMTFKQFFPADRLAEFMDKLFGEEFGGKNRLIRYETQLIDRLGSEIPVQVSANLLFDEDHEKGLVCFFRDLRAIRKLERKISDQARYGNGKDPNQRRHGTGI